MAKKKKTTTGLIIAAIIAAMLFVPAVRDKVSDLPLIGDVIEAVEGLIGETKNLMEPVFYDRNKNAITSPRFTTVEYPPGTFYDEVFFMGMEITANVPADSNVDAKNVYIKTLSDASNDGNPTTIKGNCEGIIGAGAAVDIPIGGSNTWSISSPSCLIDVTQFEDDFEVAFSVEIHHEWGSGAALTTCEEEGNCASGLLSIRFTSDGTATVTVDLGPSGLGTGPAPSGNCNDGILNQDETGVDCGGSCVSGTETACSDGMDNDKDCLVDISDPDCPSGTPGTILNIEDLAPDNTAPNYGQDINLRVYADNGGMLLGTYNVGVASYSDASPGYVETASAGTKVAVDSPGTYPAGASFNLKGCSGHVGEPDCDAIAPFTTVVCLPESLAGGSYYASAEGGLYMDAGLTEGSQVC
jgi:hypothetical protein